MRKINLLDELSDEIKEKLRACRTEEELNTVLTDANIELDPNVLDAISGGNPCHHYSAPICKINRPPFCPSNQ